MAAKKKNKAPLTDEQRKVLVKPILKSMIDGQKEGLTLVDFVEALIAVTAVLYPTTRLNIKVT